MPQLQTHNNSGRKKLVITKAPEAKQITGKDGKPLDFIEFMAKVEGEDVAVKYTNWTKSFNDFFKLDAVVDCEVTVTDQKNLDRDGNPYKNRKITQVYQDGAPVKSQQKSYGKSPETVAMEIDGKFRDTALMQSCEMAKATGKIVSVEDVLTIADKFYSWLKGEGKTAVKESVGKPQQEATLPIVVSHEPSGTRPEGMPISITDGNKLAAYVGKHGISAAEFTATVQSPPNEVNTEAQLIAAWNVLAPKMKVK